MRRRVTKLLQALCCAALAISGAGSGNGVSTAVMLPEILPPESRSTPEHTSATNDGLQVFTSSRHAVGFDESGYTVAGLDHALRVRFVGARRVHPLAANDSTATNGKAAPLERVGYRELWPSVDLSYDAGGGILRSTYQLARGADPRKIELAYNVPISIAPDGGLGMHFEQGTLRESAPVAWQVVERKHVPVTVAFQDRGQGRLGFVLGDYRSNLPLTIDPTLVWNTFLGSASVDHGWDITIDASGNIYVVGSTNATWGSPVNPHAGRSDAFVAKLDSNGALVWNTFMGSESTDYGFAIALDDSGNIHVAGLSYAAWGSPVKHHALSGIYPDAFAAKLSSSGTLIWNTFMGSLGPDSGLGITVDASGDVYLTGHSQATWGSPVNPYAGGYADAFATKLDSSGARVWSTFMGSGRGDSARCIALDSGGNVYVAGYSGATWGSPMNAHTGSDDAFAAKLNNSGTLLWNTFMGSARSDEGRSLAVDANGSAYVTGYSEATWGSPVNAYAGFEDAFAAKLDNNGTRLWHTFLGSDVFDRGEGIAVDDTGIVYVTGFSTARWGTPANPHASLGGAFIANLDSSGGRVWNTFLGANSGLSDVGIAIALHGIGNIYVTGRSHESWGAPLNPHAGNDDVFVFKLTTGSSDLVSSVLPSSRSVQVGAIATVFATMINTGANDLINCTIARTTEASASLSFWPTDSRTNAIVGAENEGVFIDAGTAQSFLLGLEPSAPFGATEIHFAFACDGMEPAPIVLGVNTLLMSASSEPIADIIALAATLNNDGIVNIPGAAGVGVFSVASVNIGAGTTVRVSADTGGATLPMSVSLCETDPASGVCLGDIAGAVTTDIAAGATPTFGIFVTGDGDVPFDPASNRVFVRFVEANGGAVRGATSVAVRTQ